MALLTDEDYLRRCGMKIIIKSYLPQSDVLTMRLLSKWLFTIVRSYPLSIIAKSFERLEEINKMIHLQRITIGTLDYSYNSRKKLGDLSKVTHLLVGKKIPLNLPKSITNLSINATANRIIPVIGKLPPTIRYLSLNFNFNDKPNVCIDFPTNLTQLVLENYNQGIDDLHLGLTHLTLKYGFNQPIDFLLGSSSLGCSSNLPQTLIHLTLGFDFNQPVDHLPSSLVYLKLGNRFNQPINYLPLGLLHLKLDTCFNHPIDHLPPNLLNLKLGYWFNQSLDHLPPNLRSLDLKDCSNFNNALSNLPQSLLHLVLPREFNKKVDNLPPNLRSLTFGRCFNQEVFYLPSTLITIRFGPYFNQPVDHLPPGLLHLYFDFSFNQRVDHLPPNLRTLQLGYKFDQPIDFLPFNLKDLTVCGDFEHRADFLPQSLICLTFLERKTHLFTIHKSLTHFSTSNDPYPLIRWTSDANWLRL